MVVRLSLENARDIQALLDETGGSVEGLVNSCLRNYLNERRRDIPDFSPRATAAEILGDMTAKARANVRRPYHVSSEVNLRGWRFK